MTDIIDVPTRQPAALARRTAEAFMPSLTIEQAISRYQTFNTFVQQVMHNGVDFGTIPGTDKPTLYKPGAEKLCTLFGLGVRFAITKEVEEWGADGSEPLFYYRVRCSLWRGDLLIAEADGSCNSREGRYRWRNAARTCPACGQATIIKGKAEYGGGWLCWGKKGGCGAKWDEGAQEIESQEAGRVLNEDVAALVNTILKMAQKRALVAATLIATNASEYFTQDFEDLDVLDLRPVVAETAAAYPQAGTHVPPSGQTWLRRDQSDALHQLGQSFYGAEWDSERARLVGHVTNNRTSRSDELSQGEAERLIAGLKARVRERQDAAQGAPAF